MGGRGGVSGGKGAGGGPGGKGGRGGGEGGEGGCGGGEGGAVEAGVALKDIWMVRLFSVNTGEPTVVGKRLTTHLEWGLCKGVDQRQSRNAGM